MRASALVSDLRAAATAAAALVARGQTIPILGHVRLDFDPAGVISVRATDLETQVTAYFAGDVEAGGSMTVPAHELKDAATVMGGEWVEIDVDMTAARLRSGRARFEMPILPVSDFPALQDYDDWQTITVDAAALRGALEFTAPFAQREGTAYALAGVRIHGVGPELRAVATDRHRIACAPICDAPEWSDTAFTIPNRAVSAALRLLAGLTGEVDLATRQGAFRLTTASAELQSATIAGDYVDYPRAMPKTYQSDLTVGFAALRDAVRRASVVGDDRAPFLRLSLSKGGLGLTGKRTFGFGEASDTMEVDYDGEPLSLGVYVSNMTEALSVSSGDDLTLSFNGPRDALRIVGSEHPGRVLVIGPVQVG